MFVTKSTPHDMVRPSVSIVVPAFNCAPFLGATLASVSGQTLTDWECIIVDDGSSDATLEVANDHASADPRFKVFHRENGGPAGARNHGYCLTDRRSEYVTFMDADDVWLPHALETLRRQVQLDRIAVGAHGLAELIDEHGCAVEPGSYSSVGRSRLGVERGRLVVWPLDRPTDFRVLVNGNVLFPPGLVLARRSAYDAVGPFDEAFRGPEDWDMLIRLSRIGYLSFLDEVVLYYRRHGSNLGAADGIERQAWLVRCKAFHSPENDEHERKVARSGWRAYQRHLVRKRYEAATAHLACHNLKAAVREFSRSGVSAFRFMRGYPTPRLVVAPRRWEHLEAASAINAERL
jgi:glycosyltransferase involved in cell wall biosynthesis